MKKPATEEQMMPLTLGHKQSKLVEEILQAGKIEEWIKRTPNAPRGISIVYGETALPKKSFDGLNKRLITNGVYVHKYFTANGRVFVELWDSRI